MVCYRKCFKNILHIDQNIPEENSEDQEVNAVKKPRRAINTAGKR